MKLLFVLLVALIGAAAVVKADEIVEPLSLEVGERIEGDKLLDLYYTESELTETPGTHTVNIQWSYNNINFLRIYAYADNAVYESTGLPNSSGTITVTSENVNQLIVTAYLYGMPDEE